MSRVFSSQMLGTFSLYVWFLIWMNVVGVSFITGCKTCNSRQAREKRLMAIQGQILAKLGLTKPPNGEEIFMNVSREVMQTYKSAVHEKDKLILESKLCRSQVDTDEEYFAKRVERLLLENEFARTIVSSSKRKNDKDVYSLRFNLGKLATESARVSLAELRLYQNPNQQRPLSNVRIDICENTREHNDSAKNGCSSTLDSAWSLSSEEKWMSFDVTSVVQKWLENSNTNYGLTVTATSSVPADEGVHVSQIYLGGPAPKQLNDKDEEPWPNILVWFIPRERVHSTRRRNRRSLDSNYCKKRPSETRCCLRSLYIDFKKDLRWKWLHAPKGFYANYCAGHCPLLWGVEKQNHHTTIMSLYNKINPDAPGDPCCVPKTYEPLVVLYFKDGEPVIDELSNMAVSECTCL